MRLSFLLLFLPILASCSNPYFILKISPINSLKHIKTQYLELVKLKHPDKPSGSQEDFILLKKAYDEIAPNHEMLGKLAFFIYLSKNNLSVFLTFFAFICLLKIPLYRNIFSYFFSFYAGFFATHLLALAFMCQKFEHMETFQMIVFILSTLFGSLAMIGERAVRTLAKNEI